MRAAASRSRRRPDPSELTTRLLAGEVRALARAMSLAEEGSPEGRRILAGVYPHTGRAVRIGITGFPGAGKSSLVDRLTGAFRERGSRVGVAAVDPSSAFSGGAILGDRIRMMQHASDDGVFIRSLATRGQFGGLSKATYDVVDLLDAAGYDRVLIETVGVGQDEVDVVESADTVVVVLVPGLGDDIQAIKAGVLEIADLFVINKADQPGVERLERELASMLSLSPDGRDSVPILRTVATRGDGIEELLEAMDAHRERLRSSGQDRLRRRRQAESRFLSLLRERLVERALGRIGSEARFDEVVERIAERRSDPYAAVTQVLADLRLDGGEKA